jgi:hypothetical protein
MTNNHERNKRKHDKRQKNEMNQTDSAWEPEPAWPVVEENGEVLGAQGVWGNTAAAAEGVEGEVRKKHRKPRVRKRGAPLGLAEALAEPATDADADNQGLPGSVMATDDVEAGQSLQEKADAFDDDPRVKYIREQHQLQLAALEEDLATRDAAEKGHKAAVKKLEDDLANCKNELRMSKNAYSTANDMSATTLDDLTREQAASKKYRDEHDETIKAAPATAAALAEAKKTMADMSSELKDLSDAKNELSAEKDALADEVAELRTENERLEAEAATSQELIETSAETTTRLDDEISHVHTEFEHTFLDMAKDLTIDEKFAYAREQQQKATLATRLASETTLHDELEETPQAVPDETLTFSKITSVETVPVAAAPAVPAVVAKKPMGFSTISSVSTPPAVSPAAAALVAAATRKPFSLSKISSVETPPVVAPTATNTKPMTFSGITSVSTAPVAAAPVPAPEVITKIVEFHTQHDRFIDRAVVPWWVLLPASIALLAFFGTSAALWRERQIWVAANDLAYKRLMGTYQETWFEWIVLGMKDLVLPI